MYLIPPGPLTTSRNESAMTSITSFNGNVDNAVAFHPFIFGAPPSERGALVGPLLGDKRPYRFDPWDWMQDGAAASTVGVYAGSKNGGKTTFMKTTARRLRLRRADRFGRVPRISVYDMKPELQAERDDEGNLVESPSTTEKKRRIGEWSPLAYAYGCTPIEVACSRINLLHPDLGLRFGEQLRQVGFLVEQVSNSGIDPYHQTALEAAVWMMREGESGLSSRLDHLYIALRRSSFEEDVNAYMKSIDVRLYEEMRNDNSTTPEQLNKFRAVLSEDVFLDGDLIRKAAFEMASSVQTALRKFGDMFTGNESLRGALGQDVVVFDCNNLSDEEIAIFQSQMRIIRSSAAVRSDDALRVDIDVHEENYASWQQRTYARDMFPYIKTVREHGTYIALIVQYLRDYETVGALGSEERSKALAMLSNVDHFFFTGMPRREIEWIDENVFPFTAMESQLTQKLGVGDFGHKTMPNHQMQFFHNQLMSSDYPIIQSNAALAERQAPQEKV
jgi:hypothetical protein